MRVALPIADHGGSSGGRGEGGKEGGREGERESAGVTYSSIKLASSPQVCLSRAFAGAKLEASHQEPWMITSSVLATRILVLKFR